MNINDRGSAHLDVLRGVAIAIVVILHVGVLTPGLETHRYIYAVFARLNVGMQLFFVLSGYLICASWERALQGKNAIATFAIKRIAKIVPLYLIFLHVNLAIFFILSTQAVPDQSYFATMDSSNVNVFNYALHLVFLQGFVPKWLNSLVDGSWSVVAEVYFYVIFPLVLYRFCATARSAFRTYLAVLLIAIFTAFIPLSQLEGNFGYYNFLYQLPCFLVGVVAYRIINQFSALISMSLWSSELLAFACILFAGLLVGNVRPMGVHNLYALMFGIVLVAMSCLPAREKWISRLAFIRRIGQQSYSLFFLHLLLLWGVRKLPGFHLESLDIPSAFAINFAVGVFGSLLISHYVVNPFDRYFVRIGSALVERMRNSTVPIKITF